jgi:hypothetical protein
MRQVVRHPDGRLEQADVVGENMTLGLGGTLLPCVCGAREFVDAWTTWPDDKSLEDIAATEPDRICPNCFRSYWYFDAEDDQAGFLH